MRLEIASVDPVRVVRHPRRGGGWRKLARLSARDARAWDELASRIAPSVESRLDPRVLADRVMLGPGTVRLRALADALRDARRGARAFIGLVLHTDIRRFYASVRPDPLEEALKHAGANPDDARTARSMLEGWEALGYRGLPVGPRGSTVFANALLLPVDRSLGMRPWLRWVDDYRIAVASEWDAARLIDRLDGTLGRLGLRRSIAKTMFGPATDLPWPGSGYDRG